jgi:hypothetical protein
LHLLKSFFLSFCATASCYHYLIYGGGPI